MAIEKVALVQNGEVVSVIVVEEGDPDGFLDVITPDYDFVEVVSGKTPEPATGWSWTSGSGYAPPPPSATLVSDKDTIIGDGTDAATVTYSNQDPNVLSPVTFDVNGASTDVPLTNGEAVIQVVSSVPGDNIMVRCQGLYLMIGVQ